MQPKAKRRGVRGAFRAGTAGRNLRKSYSRFSLMQSSKENASAVKKLLIRAGQLRSSPLTEMDVHLVAIPANRLVAVDVTMAVYEVSRVAVKSLPLAVCYDIPKIKFSRLRKQGEQFVRHVLFRSEVVRVGSLKERRPLSGLFFMSN